MYVLTDKNIYWRFSTTAKPLNSCYLKCFTFHLANASSFSGSLKKIYGGLSLNLNFNMSIDFEFWTVKNVRHILIVEIVLVRSNIVCDNFPPNLWKNSLKCKSLVMIFFINWPRFLFQKQLEVPTIVKFLKKVLKS